MNLGPNHKDTCDGTFWRHSGEGYNRVRVCNCGAEDHDPIIMKPKLSPGQHKDESTADYLRRVVSNIGFEREGMLDELKSVDAMFDFFGLWSVYDTDFWEGCMQAISEGDDPTPARDFVAKHNLGSWWSECIDDAIKSRTPEEEEEIPL